jgi:hypothetical protein
VRSRLQLAIVLVALVVAPAPVAVARDLTVQADAPNPGASPEPDPFPFTWPSRPPFGPQEQRDVFRVMEHRPGVRSGHCIIDHTQPSKDPVPWPWNGWPQTVPVADPPRRPPFGTQDAIKISDYWRSFLVLQAAAVPDPPKDADWLATWESSWKNLKDDGSVSCRLGEVLTGQSTASGLAAAQGGGSGRVGTASRPPFGTQDIKPFFFPLDSSLFGTPSRPPWRTQEAEPLAMERSPFGTQQDIIRERSRNFLKWK